MFYELIDALFGRKKFSYQRSYNRDWDAVLNRIMKEGEFIEEKNSLAKFLFNGDEYAIWASNYPYCFGHANQINGETVPFSLQFRPKKSTMEKLKALIDAPWKMQQEQAHNKMEKYIYGKD